MKEEEVDDVAQGQPVVEIAQCTSKNQRQCEAEQPFIGMLHQQPHDDDGGDDGNAAEQQLLPAARIGKEAEGGTGVVIPHEVEEAGDGEVITVGEVLQHQLLGVKIERENDGTQGQPFDQA